MRRDLVARAVGLLVLSSSLCGCGAINETLSVQLADNLPHWAGGLPDGVPPRPGSPKYEAYQAERERRRELPIPERRALGPIDPVTLPDSPPAIGVKDR